MGSHDGVEDEPGNPAERWSFTERPNGFVLSIRRGLGVGRRLLATATRVLLVAAAVAVCFDIARGHGMRGLGAIWGAAGGVLPGLIASIRRIWSFDEEVTLSERSLTHTRMGARALETRTARLGADVEIDEESLAPIAALRPLLADANAALALHTQGNTLRIGFGLSVDERARLFADIDQRVAPERRPVPGRVGVVRQLTWPVPTGGIRQRRYGGRASRPPIGSVGRLSTALLITSCLALVIGVPLVVADVARGFSADDFEVAAAVLGLAGWLILVPQRGLLDRWRRRRVTALRRRPAAGVVEPWTWHDRWPGGRTQTTALQRVLRSGEPILLPLLGGFIVWAGAPPTPLLIPVWIGLVAIAVIPMAIDLWQLAFAGTSEVGVTHLPLCPGERVDLRFALCRDSAPFTSIAFRLVRTELRRTSDLLRVAHYWTTHEGVYHLPEDTPPPGPNEEVSAFFEIPTDAGGTNEESSPAIRWFLEVRGSTSAGPYLQAFPVPVFAATSAERQGNAPTTPP
jgi:hypothetical protein